MLTPVKRKPQEDFASIPSTSDLIHPSVVNLIHPLRLVRSKSGWFHIVPESLPGHVLMPSDWVWREFALAGHAQEHERA
jgi:hypothetical protein